MVKANFSLLAMTDKTRRANPPAPFTTSTLQQEASLKLGFSVTKTMLVAQRLYESGMITYMRTDSVNLSETAIQEAKNAIELNYGGGDTYVLLAESYKANGNSELYFIPPTTAAASIMQVGCNELINL